jgi:linoleoyl-CoA desaturase
MPMRSDYDMAGTVSAGKRSFPAELRRRLDDYFTERNLSQKANAEMAMKIAAGFALWFGSYLSLYVFHLDSWKLVLDYLVLGIAHLYFLFNIAHDGIHYAISRKRSINLLFSYGYEFCGVNSYLARALHNRAHHACINIEGEDDPLSGRGVFRYTPFVRKKAMHRYQHLYVPFLYALVSLDYVFIRDFADFFSPTQECLKRARPPAREYVILCVGKILYLALTILLPIVVLGRSPLLIVTAFLLMHFIVGLGVAAVFGPTHIVDSSYFPESRGEFGDYIYHIFATTTDFATRSKLVTFATGGLNHHIVHHICPYVCHTHYPQLTEIVKRTAAEYHVPYMEEPTMSSALVSHVALLKRLATES